MRLSIGNVSIAQSDVSIQNPDGSQLVPATYVARNTVFSVDTPVLPASGTYTVSFTPRNNYTGTATFRLFKLDTL